MSDPLVCAVLLTRDRPEMAARAVRSFRAQTYERKRLLIYNTGESDEIECGCNPHCYHVQDEGMRRKSIGAARNAAINFRNPYHPEGADIICHWDDDDVSHPNRIAEQVALLQSSGAEVVGYNQLLFWRQRNGSQGCSCHNSTPCPVHPTEIGGEAWLYTGPAHTPPGTSLCYWRRTWEAHRFDDRKNVGEDCDFCRRVGHQKIKSVSSLVVPDGIPGCICHGDGLMGMRCDVHPDSQSPRLVATVHGSNTQQPVYDAFFKGGTVEMKRAPEWDAVARRMVEEA